jgi:hypothetical protein
MKSIGAADVVPNAAQSAFRSSAVSEVFSRPVTSGILLGEN